jgi:tripartite-type tricarboxylate transporter receptor subunit TctC
MRLNRHIRRRSRAKWALGIMRALSIILCALMTIAGDAVAEEWPTRPIKLVVPYSAGGSGDIVARELAQKPSTYLDRSVYVENRPGASGNLGTEYVAKSAPDGHTLLMASDIQFAISPNFTAGLPYEFKDFEPVSLVANLDLVLAAHPSVAATNLRELAELARKRPGEINYGSTGAGSTHQLAMELLQQLGGFKLTEVPYRGSAQALPDLLSGQLQIMLMGIPQSLPYMRDGKLNALAVGALQRVASIPDVPTIAEQGYPGFEANNYWCLYAPAGTQKNIIAKLQQGTAQAVAAPDLRERFIATGLTPVGSTPHELATRIAVDSAKWTNVIRGLRLNEVK